MKKLILKCSIYFLITLIILEILVRIFHLAKDNPNRYLDEYNVEKWKPNQTGYSVTGNRNQNFSAYNINNFGYNSYREFEPTKDKFEIALVGDSFIQGFHQNYYHSIGKKIEETLPTIEVYEYGYAGYDYADQIHLIDQYKQTFNLIDKVIIYINFEDDLTRGTYKVIHDRLNLEKGFSKHLKKSKLIVYIKSIGIFTPIKNFAKNILSIRKKENKQIEKFSEEIEKENLKNYEKYILNFEKLNATHNYNKNKFILLLDSKTTPKIFLNHLKNKDYKYIDFRSNFNTTTKSKTLIYDQHWNNHGRELVAKSIVQYANQL